MKSLKYLSLIALAFYSQSVFAMEQNSQEARSKSPTFAEEIKAAMPEDLDARIAAAMDNPKGFITRKKIDLFGEIDINMYRLLNELVAKMPEDAAEKASQIHAAVENIAKKLWGESYKTNFSYEVWLKRYRRQALRISRGESLEERLKRPLFKEIKPMPASEEDEELKKMMRDQEKRRKKATLESQDFSSKNQMSAAESQALHNEARDLLKAHKSQTAEYKKENLERFKSATSIPRTRLNAFNNQANLSDDDADKIMRILDGVEYTAQKIWGDSYMEHEKYQRWLAETKAIRKKATQAIYGDMPALE